MDTVPTPPADGPYVYCYRCGTRHIGSCFMEPRPVTRRSVLRLQAARAAIHLGDLLEAVGIEAATPSDVAALVASLREQVRLDAEVRRMTVRAVREATHR